MRYWFTHTPRYPEDFDEDGYFTEDNFQMCVVEREVEGI